MINYYVDREKLFLRLFECNKHLSNAYFLSLYEKLNNKSVEEIQMAIKISNGSI